MSFTLDLSGEDGDDVIEISPEKGSGEQTDPFLKNLDAAMSQYIRGNVAAAMMNLRDAGIFLAREHDINMPFIG